MALDFLCSAPIYFTVLNLYSNSHLIIRDEKKEKNLGDIKLGRHIKNIYYIITLICEILKT